MDNHQLSVKSYPLYKDSAIAWLGDVPEHWEVKRIQDLAYKIGDGLHGTPNYIDSSDFYFGSSGFKGISRTNEKERLII